jgi:CheY-like chemotaxis protein
MTVVKAMARRPARADGRNADSEGCPEASVDEGIANRRVRRALIVDDEPDILDILASLLEDVGWTPLPALSPEDALRIAAAAPIDLMLCDICLPRMDGIELLRHMRARKLIGEAPVVLMSAARRLAPDGVLFLPKPFDLDEIVSLLDRIAPE